MSKHYVASHRRTVTDMPYPTGVKQQESSGFLHEARFSYQTVATRAGEETTVTNAAFTKRVLLLATRLPDGGINTHMLTLGSELRKLGWEVGICSGGPLEVSADMDARTNTGQDAFPPAEGHYERAGIAHFDVSIPGRPHRLSDLPHLLRLPLAMWQVLRAVRRFRPSVLHIHTRQMGVYARVVQSLMGVPFVSTMHNPVPSSGRLFAKMTFLGSMAVGVSDEIRTILIQDYGVEPTRARVVLPGADAYHFRPPTVEERQSAQDHYAIRAGQYVLAFIGSLITRKRPDTLISAVADLVASGYDVVALIAGRGAEEEAISSQAARLGIAERVRMLGYQDPRSVLWAADALVLPSDSEGFPLVTTEAMLSGVVAMRTPSGGADQVTPGVTGVVFGIGDHVELARKVAELIERPDSRETLVTSALEDARNRFSSMQMARTIEGIYAEVVAEQHRW